MPEFKSRNTRRARELRNHATDAEKLLWRHLSRRQLAGWKFSRQLPVGPFFCDFVCREAKLVIELDGGQHALQVRQDASRTQLIESEGFRVLRFWNHDVLGNPDGVLTRIGEALTACPPPTPPASGRGAR
nr:DUF559 domain-containing protein [uncultured Sphingosinicella sp.]